MSHIRVKDIARLYCVGIIIDRSCTLRLFLRSESTSVRNNNRFSDGLLNAGDDDTLRAASMARLSVEMAKKNVGEIPNMIWFINKQRRILD